MKIINLLLAVLAILVIPVSVKAVDIDCTDGCEVCYKTQCKFRKDEYDAYDGYLICQGLEGIEEFPMARCEDYGYGFGDCLFLWDWWYDYYDYYEYYGYWGGDCQDYCETVLKDPWVSYYGYSYYYNYSDFDSNRSDIEEYYSARFIDDGEEFGTYCDNNEYENDGVTLSVTSKTSYLVKAGSACEYGFLKLSDSYVQTNCPETYEKYLKKRDDGGRGTYGNYKIQCDLTY
jgi:hypothetical protein